MIYFSERSEDFGHNLRLLFFKNSFWKANLFLSPGVKERRVPSPWRLSPELVLIAGYQLKFQTVQLLLLVNWQLAIRTH
jgi:hypothetical protein